MEKEGHDALPSEEESLGDKSGTMEVTLNSLTGVVRVNSIRLVRKVR